MKNKIIEGSVKSKEECTLETKCSHFMVWNRQADGYFYYRCSKCDYIDGKKTFADVERLTKKKFIQQLINWAKQRKYGEEDLEALDENKLGYTCIGYNEALEDLISYLQPKLKEDKK